MLITKLYMMVFPMVLVMGKYLVPPVPFIISPFIAIIIGLIFGGWLVYKSDRLKRPEVSPHESWLLIGRRLKPIVIYVVLYLILYPVLVFIVYNITH